MNYLSNFPLHVQTQINKIKDILSPHTKRAYLVGGCVRDLFLKNPIKDLDIEVYDIAPDNFDSLMRKIGANGVGKSFFVYKFEDIDLALPRIERKVGVGHKAYEVDVVNDEKIASKRRDFSMNAMMIDIFSGELLDFWGGFEAIKKKELSLIDETSFKEDSLRVLRAVQFSARFNLHVEKNTLHVMKNIDLNDLSKTRIFWELEKLFNAKYLDVGFFYMYELGLFEKIFGISLDKSIKNNLKDISDGFEEDLRAYYFLYLVANLSNKNPLDLAKKIKAPNHYLRVYKYQPFFKNIPSNYELLEVAIELPIKNWLGNYKEEIKINAKKLDIWDKKYTGGINIQDVIKDGFSKENIKKEYKRRVLFTILKK
ncbi:CCA tRNA nucleotidyltransferase [Sulfurospirillum sp. 1307]|jgi:tRNA nucleotidyltransferase (CCA-adding enzyme)